MTTLPATVTIQDLPVGTTLSGTELLEAVQTSGGVAASVQISVSQIMTAGLGGLPTGGATGQFLAKTSGTNYAANWSSISSFVVAGTALTETGSTTIMLSLSSTAGLSVLGVTAAGSAVPAAIAGTADQVFIINHAGSSALFGAVNLATAAAVTGVLPGANYSAVNLAGTGAGGVQGLLPGTSIATASIGSTQIATGAILTTQLLTAAGLSVLAVASSGTSNFSLVTGAANQLLAVNPAGTTVLFETVSTFLDGAVGSTQGDIIYRNAATWVILAPGTNGQLLQTQGAAANPQWIGGMVLLNTLTANNVATVGDTTSLTSTYRNYMVTFENVVPATTATLQLQLATSGTAFISGSYVSQAQVNASSIFVTDTSTTVILLSGLRATTQVGSTTTYGVNGFIKTFNPANATFRKMWVGDLSFLPPGASGTTIFAQTQIAGYFDGAVNAITGFQINFNTGNIATGTIRVYGIF